LDIENKKVKNLLRIRKFAFSTASTRTREGQFLVKKFAKRYFAILSSSQTFQVRINLLDGKNGRSV